MPNSEQRRPAQADRRQEEPATGPDSGQARRAALDAEVDQILDEIDEVLESNAEEFVKGFVQKGGE